MKKAVIFLIILLNGIGVQAARKAKPAPWVKEKVAIAVTAKALSKKSPALTVFSSTDISCEGDYILIKKKLVYKILKTTGLSYGQLIVLSNTRSKVYGIKGWRFSKTATHVESLSKETIKERAYNLNFYDDSKQYIASFKNIEKGDIVVFEYKQKLHRYFRDYSTTLGDSIDTIYESITINGNAKTSILNNAQNIAKQDGNTFYVENLPMLKSESFSGPDRDRLPIIVTTYDISTNSSWKTFGDNFIAKTKHALDLNSQTKAELSDLFAIQNEKEFILKTIEHVTNNINYVDVEFGVGGFIPRECNFVHSKKYGDCKDMAYYAVAILRAKGVNAYPVLARTKDIGMLYKEFVCDQFNHVIMAVELNQKTQELKNIEIEKTPYLIADLTDRYSTPPLLSTSIEGTYGLMLKENSSKLFKIPYSTPEKNKLNYNININFDYNRRVNIEMTETQSGHFLTSEKQFLDNVEETKKREKYANWVQSFVPGARLKAFDANYNNNEAITTVSFVSANSGVESGSELYFFPNIVDNDKKGFKRKRFSDIKFRQLYEKEISIVSSISKNFKIISIPKNMETDNKYFFGAVKAEKRNNNVFLSTKIIWKTTKIPLSEYKTFRKLFKKYLKAAKAPIVLTKENN